MENQVLPKWLVGGLGGLLIALVALLVVQKAHDLQTAFANTKPANTISVSGDSGKSYRATPDLATVNIGVLSQGTTAVDVKNQNNDKVNKIVAFVKAQGVANGDITTSQLSFNPTQDYSNGTPKITGYQGQQSITGQSPRCRAGKDQTVLENILDGAVNNGANEIDGVSLSVENPDALQQQAQQMAIANAKTKAQALAQTAGLTLGKVVSVSENNVAVPGPLSLCGKQHGYGAGYRRDFHCAKCSGWQPRDRRDNDCYL